jgi:hydrogenase maturation protease
VPRPIAMSRLLILACGNPSRGDDALGPCLIDRLSMAPTLDRSRILLLTDFQLQIEHILDLEACERVIFVDAASTGPAPFVLVPVRSQPEIALSTHSLSPGTLLHLFRKVTGQAPPPARLLAIRGYGFDLGASLTDQARINLELAFGLLTRIRLNRG